MLAFGIRFFICNIFITFMIGIILASRHLFYKNLSSRMRYHLWFVMLALLAVPFLPIQVPRFMQLHSWIDSLKTSPASATDAVLQTAYNLTHTTSSNWMTDFSISISKETPSTIGLLLLSIWLIGILAMIILVVKSKIQLHHLKHSALPLQNQKVWKLYHKCLEEIELNRNIPLYSTAFLKSPIIIGLFSPQIYLPIHLIADYNATDMRYIILHELQHYKHKDALANYLMNLAGILYWFNPFVWYALKEMRNDREIACDTSVLEMLNENDYEDYGNTLINFAQKLSLSPFPFASGIGDSMKQIKCRILNIASYETPPLCKKLKSIIAFTMTCLLLFGLAPLLSIYAAEDNNYQWEVGNKTIDSADFSAYFEEYEGSFVLYDLEGNSWKIYNEDNATRRSAPNSTYKIFDALFGLEIGIITPEQSQMKWNQVNYPFEAWNSNQDLRSAMQNSVNWYFQSIDAQVGSKNIKKYIQEIAYGNQDMTGDISSYWMESSLKISPIEQVELLQKLYHNDFGFNTDNIQAVKDSLRLSSSSQGSIYGKTGSGRVNDEYVNSWFVGYTEVSGRTHFFATNIQAAATGSKASEITLSLLSDLNIWK